jgi:hypothetical protein
MKKIVIALLLLVCSVAAQDCKSYYNRNQMQYVLEYQRDAMKLQNQSIRCAADTDNFKQCYKAHEAELKKAEDMAEGQNCAVRTIQWEYHP